MTADDLAALAPLLGSVYLTPLQKQALSRLLTRVSELESRNEAGWAIAKARGKLLGQVDVAEVVRKALLGPIGGGE